MIFKKLLIWSSASIAAVSPVALVAACTNSNEQNDSLQATTLKTNLNVNQLGLSSNIKEAVKQINPLWIIKNKNNIFDGETKYLNNPSQIEDIKFSVENANQLNVNLKLAAQSYVDTTGELAQNSANFNLVINGFIEENPTEQKIDLNILAQQATFDVKDKNRLASQVKTSEIIWNQEQNNKNVLFTVNNLIPDDKTGKLGFNFTFSQINYPNNHLTINVDSSSNKSINGFTIAKPTPNDQTLVDQEATRLTNLGANQIINLTSLKVEQLNQYQMQPNSFLTNLNHLNQSQFQYQINQFSYRDVTKNNSQALIAINLLISKNGAQKTISLEKTIGVEISNNPDEKPPVTNEDLVRSIELKRLNNLINNSFLTKTVFNEQEIKQLASKPNDVLKILFAFVNQQYFQYRVSDFKINLKSRSEHQVSATINFAIEARLWKADDDINKVIKSEQFSFPITINYQSDDSNNLDPSKYTWKIKPVSKAIDNNDGSYDLTIDLNNNSNLDLAQVNWNDGDEVEKIVKQMFKDQQNLFVDVEGTLDPNWTWDDNFMSTGFEATKTNGTKVDGFNGVVYILNFNSQDLEDQLILDLKFINGYNSGQTNGSTNDPEKLWQQYQKDFQALIAKQEFDQQKLHLGNNDVYSFSQIVADRETDGRFFANFLNFSPSEFWKSSQWLVKPTVSEAKINYLTNEVSFKWNLEGRNNQSLGINLSGKTWTSNVQTIKYQPSGNWKDVINFQTNDQLAIANSVSINNILDRFAISNNFRDVNSQKELLERFGKNWTWKAREFAQYLRFTFYQAFNDGADAINMGIINLPKDELNQNPDGYTIVLKAKLNDNGAGQYNPFFQMFGAGANTQSRNWQAGDIVELRLTVDSVAQIPDVVTAAGEILPGFGIGDSLGKGRGVNDVYLNQPPRTDMFSIFMGSQRMEVKVNDQIYMSSTKAVHRYLGFNLMNRYNFQDPIWKEPPKTDGWI